MAWKINRLPLTSPCFLNWLSVWNEWCFVIIVVIVEFLTTSLLGDCVDVFVFFPLYCAHRRRQLRPAAAHRATWPNANHSEKKMKVIEHHTATDMQPCIRFWGFTRNIFSYYFYSNHKNILKLSRKTQARIQERVWIVWNAVQWPHSLTATVHFGKKVSI